LRQRGFAAEELLASWWPVKELSLDGELPLRFAATSVTRGRGSGLLA
jgi:hypothetical protein